MGGEGGAGKGRRRPRSAYTRKGGTWRGGAERRHWRARARAPLTSSAYLPPSIARSVSWKGDGSASSASWVNSASRV
eukprot:6506314-Prymnesium_polylepis.1